MGTIVGIDLGTTNSAVAYMTEGKAEIIPNRFGQRTTPSVVAMMNNQIVVGKLAKDHAMTKPEQCILEVKRLMGSRKRIKIGENDYSPEEISALILGQLKEDIEEYLGETVDEAVITVPANFNELQRSATKKAGELAGFKVDRIINEPTAAAMAYSFMNMESEEKVLVYDFGGGTFDVTILDLFQGIADVRVSRGDNALGGKNVDEEIEKHVIEDINKTYSIDISKNAKAVKRIKEEAEKAKIQLSQLKEVEMDLPYIAADQSGQPISHTMVITRKQLNEWIKPIVEKTKKIMLEAIKSANYTTEDITAVILVGGSTRLIEVREMLKELYGDKIKASINPDEVVALGASIQAGINSGAIDKGKSIILTDICNFTLGTSICKEDEHGKFKTDLYDPLISRDTKVPCVHKKIYKTIYDNQTSMTIDVYEGEEKSVKYNTKIAEFEVTDIPKAPKGQERVEISFSYSENGLLTVEAIVVNTGSKLEKVVDISQLKVPDYLLRSYKMLMKLSDADKEWDQCKMADSVKDIIAECDKNLSKFSGDDYINLEILMNRLKIAVIEEDKEAMEAIKQKLKDQLSEIA